MDAKHTPGPWHVGEDGDMVWGPKHKGSHVLVANVPFSKDPRVEADARLIAAAPTLYAVVKYAVDNPDFDSETFDALCREALSKATGAAP